MSFGKAFLPVIGIIGLGLDFTPTTHLYAQTKVAQAPKDSISQAVDAAKALPPVPVVNGDPEKGKLLYGTCVACHGKDAEGNKMFNSPRLATQLPWYNKRQLLKFREGVRGAHPQDVFGMQMAPMAKLLPDEATTDNVIAYIATLKPQKPVDRGIGDPEKGKALFAVCSACHGPKAQGNPTLKAPKLTGQHAWYLEKQVANFKSGVRGAHAADAEGKLIGPIFSQALADSSAIADVVAYIQSLSEE